MTSPEENVKTTAAAMASAARAFARSGGGPDWSVLCEAAEAFAKARWAMKAPPPKPGANGLTIPFGKNKGTPLGEATTKDLQYVAGVLAESIVDPAKSKWVGKNQELLAGIESELRTR